MTSVNMTLYDKIELSRQKKDAEQYLDLLHEDYEFIRHQSGTSVNKEEIGDLVRFMMSSNDLEVRSPRCIYENEDIIVEHSVMDFPDGTTEAVMTVHMIKDGKIIRTETGATLIPNEV
jgi:hypothetical protein|tara:strand:+ start:427 stop:780 length:354 start_codon:yes stop_codon:yes gene_type:complete